MPDYAHMNQLLYEGNGPEVARLTQAALDEGRTPQEVLQDGLIAGMSVVGEDFKHNILYVPEVLIAARAMKAGMAVLKPLLSGEDGGGNSSKVGTLMMGTVRGDLHDIGKNLVCMMAEGAGFEVVDIGVDQSVEKFMAAADQCKPDIIGMSALLTTTMTYMKTVIDGFAEAGRTDIKFAVGGAPISQMFADEIGADGYGQDASSAVDLFLHFVGKGDAPDNKPKYPPPATTKADPDAPKGTSTTYQVLYWQDLPAQIKASDEYTEVKIELPPPFIERIDAAAQRLGLTAEADYTAQFKWGDEQTRPGDAATVAATIQSELESTAG